MSEHECLSAGTESAVECGDCPPAGYPDKSRCGACPQRASSARDTELLATLVYEAMRFAIWAAGQGLMAEKGEPTRDPEDFLFDYSKAMDIDDWEGLAEVARDHIRAVPQAMRETFVDRVKRDFPEFVEDLGRPELPLEMWTTWARRDDWHERFVGSDIRQMLGEIQRLREHFDNLPAQPQTLWQPIETAPKDGSKIDLWHPSKGRFADAFWCKQTYTLYEPYGWSNQQLGRITGVTHWMPITSPLTRPKNK